jgi:hypothetical protein
LFTKEALDRKQDGKDGKDGKPKGGRGGKLPNLMDTPGISGAFRDPRAAVATAVVGSIVAADRSKPETDAYFEDQRKKKEVTQ